MSKQATTVVPGDESEIHDEPHVRGRRITVSYIHASVEERGLRPETVAERHDLSLSAVYHALAYYHDHPDEMRQVEKKREQAGDIARQKSDLTPSE
ncbi:MAG: DUF433 domain-containing protein [Haloarculaceae archaeon]